jgi:hypothetical protein
MHFAKVKIPCNLFGVIPVVDSSNGILQDAFSYRIFISPSIESVDFRSFSAMMP